MIISNFQNIQNVTDLPSLVRYANIDFNLILAVINGNVDLVANCSTDVVAVNFLKASTTYQFNHNLDRVPQGYISIGMNVSSVVFNGNQANTTGQIFLQASAISSGKVLVF